MEEATRALTDLGRGDTSAEERLLSLVYDELRSLAAAHLRRERPGHTLQPTALVHEAWMRLVDQEGLDWRNRAQFFALAARTIRRVLVDHARARSAEKRGGGPRPVTLVEDLELAPGPALDVLALDEALVRLGSLAERQARVVELRFFGGLSVDEAAHVLGVSPRTVEGDWSLARAWLRRELGPPGEP